MESQKIKVFKFGGASVKDADSIRNVAALLKRFKSEKILVVISAMGKITNALELVHKSRFQSENPHQYLQQIRIFHEEIIQSLFGNLESTSPTMRFLDELEDVAYSPCSQKFDEEYDRMVGYGELISTSIVQSFLVNEGFQSAFLDARQIVRTDNRHRDARVDWPRSAMATEKIKALFQKSEILIIQGFIGSGPDGQMTTLGREGSDFTAAIMAFLIDAQDVTVWKDVPGMLNADPKWFKETIKLDRISFHEAIELAYFGASVIHPKTIKPLQNKGIPLYIKSFVHPELEGTIIQENTDDDHLIPSYIFKNDQVLISLTPKDFSFVVEDHLKEIFEVLSQLGIRINLMENSAISFSICVDKDEYKKDLLFKKMSSSYKIRYNEGLTLLTIRHYDETTVKKLTLDREVLLEQRSRHTMRLVLR